MGAAPADESAVECARALAESGYLAFSISYRLAPPGLIPGQKSTGQFPEQYDDVHLAVAAARNDPRSNGKVGAVGGSAGATHGVWCAATGVPGVDRLDAVVGLSGAYDFADFSPDPGLKFFIETVTNYVDVPETDTRALRAASPAWVVTADVAPLYLIDSEEDTMPSVQLENLVTHLTAVGRREFLQRDHRGRTSRLWQLAGRPDGGAGVSRLAPRRTAAHAHSDTNRDSHTDSDADSDSHANSEREPDSYAHPCGHARLAP